MIYMDNAATSYPKPSMVLDALWESVARCGNPGRGAHRLSVWAGEKVLEAREVLGQLFHVQDASRFAFTHNATHALNIAVSLCYGEILTTAMDHNSVLRPCAKRGYFRIVPADPTGHIEPETVINHISDMTGAVIMTHASNVTGEIYQVAPIAHACRKRGVLFILDCAQSAGAVEIDLQDIPVDILCLTGHKGLFGLQGTGAVYIAPHVPTRAYMCGGTGTNTFDFTHPEQMPEVFEAGTVNTHGIASLCAGVQYVLKQGIQNIREKENDLRDYFTRELCRFSKVHVYGDLSGHPYTGVLSLNVLGSDPGTVANYLAEKEICVRSGFHCAPLAHEAIGTVRQGGTVRFSLNHLNTKSEIDTVLTYLEDFCKKL
ncbi:MAG: aminotransferase class V-fold PLP-dependent enzyme [Clostridia bacterium]|nr:aminotransferase class V-fold PLP-dependent enzyme [Clostridia bacterium]